MQPDNQAKFSGHPEFVLFSRSDCHLCDIAAELLEAENIHWVMKNIETDICLISRYGTRIPVLFRPGTGAELGWPFTAEDLRKFVETSK